VLHWKQSKKESYFCLENTCIPRCGWGGFGHPGHPWLRP